MRVAHRLAPIRRTAHGSGQAACGLAATAAHKAKRQSSWIPGRECPVRRLNRGIACRVRAATLAPTFIALARCRYALVRAGSAAYSGSVFRSSAGAMPSRRIVARFNQTRGVSGGRCLNPAWGVRPISPRKLAERITQESAAQQSDAQNDVGMIEDRRPQPRCCRPRQPERRDVSAKAARIYGFGHDGTSTTRKGTPREAKTVPSLEMLQIQASTAIEHPLGALRVKQADDRTPGCAAAHARAEKGGR